MITGLFLKHRFIFRQASLYKAKNDTLDKYWCPLLLFVSPQSNAEFHRDLMFTQWNSVCSVVSKIIIHS